MTTLDTLQALYEGAVWLSLIATVWGISNLIWGTKR